MSDPATCDGLRVTAYVDGGLPPEARAEVEAHLATCPACREQEAFERGLREKMRALPAIEPPSGLEDRVRRRLRRRPVPAAFRWLPVAAALALVLLWVRGAAPFVALEVSLDHIHCFGRPRLPAQVWSNDPSEIAEWYRDHGTEVPLVPVSAGGVELVGGRFCPLLDRRVAHLYYAGERRHLSLYVVPGPARFSGTFVTRRNGETVRLLHTGGSTVALVGEDPDTVEAFHRALSITRADGAGVDPDGASYLDPPRRGLLASLFTPVGL
jgi:anti-sigma factor RsiW